MEKENADSVLFLFPYSQFVLLKFGKPKALCLEVKMIMNTLYANVSNFSFSKKT